jgi:predicted acylesterase/phospholipase RssA
VSDAPVDLLLSSGYLAFARHAGVLRVVEERGVPVDAVVGTSSGSLVGALWASGMSSERIVTQLEAARPWRFVALHAAPWRGLLRLDPMVAWLHTVLPPTFAGLARPFAVGVSVRRGDAVEAHLLTDGPLPEAIAASCAIPGLFASPMDGPWGAWRDGGYADRLMAGPWRAWRGERPGLGHAVARSAGREVPLPASLPVIRTPRARASLWGLRDVRAQADEAADAARRALDAAGR